MSPLVTVTWTPCARPSWATSGRWYLARVSLDGRPVLTHWSADTVRDRRAWADRARACTTPEQLESLR